MVLSMPKSTECSLSVNYTHRFWTLFLKSNASHTSLISIVGAVTSWKLLRLLVLYPLKIRIKNLAVPTYNSGTLCCLYKGFTNGPFWAQFTQICDLFFLPTFRNNMSVSSSRVNQNCRTILNTWYLYKSAFKGASFAEHKIKTVWRTEKFFNKQQTKVFAELSRKCLVTEKLQLRLHLRVRMIYSVRNCIDSIFSCVPRK